MVTKGDEKYFLQKSSQPKVGWYNEFQLLISILGTYGCSQGCFLLVYPASRLLRINPAPLYSYKFYDIRVQLI